MADSFRSTFSRWALWFASDCALLVGSFRSTFSRWALGFASDRAVLVDSFRSTFSRWALGFANDSAVLVDSFRSTIFRWAPRLPIWLAPLRGAHRLALSKWHFGWRCGAHCRNCIWFALRIPSWHPCFEACTGITQMNVRNRAWQRINFDLGSSLAPKPKHVWITCDLCDLVL